VKLWRISKFLELNGAGGLQAAGRWHRVGRRVVYTAEHSALALLELLVQLERRRAPPTYQLLEIEAPDDLAVVDFAGGAPADTATSQAWGDEWLRAGSTALAKVPSAIAPQCFNYLINPAHDDAERIKLIEHGHYPWDLRLFR